MSAALVLALAVAGSSARSDLDRELLAAARAGDVARVRRAIGAGARVEARDADGFSPLMRAAGADSSESVRLLLSAGADLDAARPTGWTALMEAAAHGSLDAARQLLERGASADARDRGFGTALDIAERSGQARIADLLRSHGAHGSGRSVGNRACALPWRGAGFCGRIDAIDGTRYRLLVDQLQGCEEGCAADADCSEGRAVGGADAGAVREGSSVWIRSWCLTHTGLP